MIRPTVSICIPVHNPDREQLGVLLRSLAAQDRLPDEVVISDDCSGVDVKEMVAELSGDLPVTVLRQEINLGMTGNWNAVVRASSGDLVVQAHQDDALEPAMLERYVAVFADRDDVVLCSSNERCVDGSGRPVSSGGVNRRDRVYVREPEYWLCHEDLVRLCLRNGQGYGEPSAVMFRRDIFDEVGGYSDLYEHAADVDFVLRVSRLGLSAYLRDRLVVRRIHGGNLTKAHIAGGASGRDRERLVADHLSTIDVTVDERAAIGVAVASHGLFDLLRAVRDRRWTVARTAAAAVWRHGRCSPRAWWRQARELITGRNLDVR